MPIQSLKLDPFPRCDQRGNQVTQGGYLFFFSVFFCLNPRHKPWRATCLRRLRRASSTRLTQKMSTIRRPFVVALALAS